MLDYFSQIRFDLNGQVNIFSIRLRIWIFRHTVRVRRTFDTRIATIIYCPSYLVNWILSTVLSLGPIDTLRLIIMSIWILCFRRYSWWRITNRRLLFCLNMIKFIQISIRQLHGSITLPHGMLKLLLRKVLHVREFTILVCIPFVFPRLFHDVLLTR